MKLNPGDLVKTSLVATHMSRNTIQLTNVPSLQIKNGPRTPGTALVVTGLLGQNDTAIVISTTNDSRYAFIVCPGGVGYVYGAMLTLVG